MQAGQEKHCSTQTSIKVSNDAVKSPTQSHLGKDTRVNQTRGVTMASGKGLTYWSKDAGHLLIESASRSCGKTILHSIGGCT